MLDDEVVSRGFPAAKQPTNSKQSTNELNGSHEFHATDQKQKDQTTQNELQNFKGRETNLSGEGGAWFDCKESSKKRRISIYETHRRTTKRKGRNLSSWKGASCRGCSACTEMQVSTCLNVVDVCYNTQTFWRESIVVELIATGHYINTSRQSY